MGSHDGAFFFSFSDPCRGHRLAPAHCTGLCPYLTTAHGFEFPREHFWTVLLAMFVMFALVLDNDNSVWKEGFSHFVCFCVLQCTGIDVSGFLRRADRGSTHTQEENIIGG